MKQGKGRFWLGGDAIQILRLSNCSFDFLKGRAYSGTCTGSSKCRMHTELKEAIEAGKGEALAYSDKLVRDFIEKIEVCPSMLRVALKAGVSTMVKM